MSKELFIGLMSGTSVDGVDSSIVAFENNKIEIVLHTVKSVHKNSERIFFYFVRVPKPASNL